MHKHEGDVAMQNLNRVIAGLQSENRRLESELARVRGALAALRGLSGKGITLAPRRRLSAAARKRIADAQRARWAKVRAKTAA